MKKTYSMAVIISSVFIVGCMMYVVVTDWSADIPFKKGTVRVFLSQEHPVGSVTTDSYGSVYVNLNSPKEIRDFKMHSSAVIIKFFKEEVLIEEQRIFPGPYTVNDKNQIFGTVGTYNKYVTPSSGKQLSLDWDNFMRRVKMSDRIDCSIQLDFEANGQRYLINEVGELEKDVKRNVYLGHI